MRWFLRAALLFLPLPWIAAELGWIVAEYGRQPWAVEGILPTALGVSTTAGNVLFSLVGLSLSIRRCWWRMSICWSNIYGWGRTISSPGPLVAAKEETA